MTKVGTVYEPLSTRASGLMDATMSEDGRWSEVRDGEAGIPCKIRGRPMSEWNTVKRSSDRRSPGCSQPRLVSSVAETP